MDKKAGREHRDNKAKYKKYKPKNQTEKPKTDIKSEKTTTEEKKRSETVLPSNWSRYEIPDDSVPDDYSGAANFELLLEESLSQASHFKFKNEQSWTSNVELQSQFSKYFTVDLKLLGEGVQCIPFTTRNELDVNIFSVLAIEQMNEKAKTHTKKFQAFLDKKYPPKANKKVSEVKQIQQVSDVHDTNKENKLKCKNECQVEEPICEKEQIIKDEMVDKVIYQKNECKNLELKNEEKELDSLLDLKISEIQNDSEPDITVEDPLLATIPIVKKTVTSTGTDLEQWLDDILDD